MRTEGLALLSIVCMCSLIQAQQTDIKTLKSKFDNGVLAIDLGSSAANSSIITAYTNELHDLRISAQNAGNLEKLTAVIAEITRANKKRSLPADIPDVPEIKTLVLSYQNKLKDLTRQRGLQIITLTAQYDKALEALQQRLTQKGDVHAATQVRDERQRVSNSELLLSARITVEEPTSSVTDQSTFDFRTLSGRETARRKYGGSDEAEVAVLRALRWLKISQNTDGSWNANKCAMTAFALLTYLSHGETPASEEFGQTIERAIRFLVDGQQTNGRFSPSDPHDYTHPIATYALCEAYGMTKAPMLKDAAEKALDVMIKGQHPNGGFNYNLNLNDVTRNDSTFMSWCCQALKAAKTAGLANKELNDVIDRAIEGWKVNMRGDATRATIGYTAPGDSGLTGGAVLCLQILGAGNDPLARGGMNALQHTTYNWQGGGTYNNIYYWYHITQAMFHAGGRYWTKWNTVFAPVLIHNQTTIRQAGKDPSGKMVDVGYWMPGPETSGHTDNEGRVMNTCLCALQLQVYYRYPPAIPAKRANSLTGRMPSPDMLKGGKKVDTRPR